MPYIFNLATSLLEEDAHLRLHVCRLLFFFKVATVKNHSTWIRSSYWNCDSFWIQYFCFSVLILLWGWVGVDLQEYCLCSWGLCPEISVPHVPHVCAGCVWLFIWLVCMQQRLFYNGQICCVSYLCVAGHTFEVQVSSIEINGGRELLSNSGCVLSEFVNVNGRKIPT